MASPITWQNVTGPRNDEVFRGLAAAGTSINAGFDQFNKVIQQRADAEKAALEANSAYAREQLLNTLQGARTPEDIVKLQESGQLDQMRAGLMTKDLAAVRGAEDARTAAVQKVITERQAFEQNQLAQKQLPQVNEIKKRIAGGDFAGARSLLQASPDLIEGAALAQAATEAERAGKRFGWESDRAADEQQMRPLQRQATEQQIAASKAQVTRANQESEDRRQARLDTEAAKAAEQVQKLTEKLTQQNNGLIGSEAGLKAVTDSLSTVFGKDSEKLQMAVGSLNRALEKNPALRELPVDAVQSAVLKLADSIKPGWLWNSDYSTEIGKALDAAMETQQPGMLARQAVREDLLAKIQRARGVADRADRRAYPDLFGTAEPSSSTAQGERARNSNDDNPGTVVAPRGSRDPEPSTSQGLGLDAARPNPAIAAEQAIQRRLYDVETAEIAAGERDSYSAEAQKFLDARTAADRQAIISGVNTAGDAAQNLNAAALDLVTMIPRGLMGATNTAIRGLNALGAPVPYLPDEGYLSSLTPYSDRLALSRNSLSKEELAKQRKQLEKELAELRKKN
ncbi:hypothetical protein [Xenophilus sp. Marseille-Q4582]|uniref:hypothetical protein n=1 Tax=Xenophilus sp. Marseille-Q4582 TaxID=2866600 RepID=UPI001CE40025|nr:hypothetical protein [Xenophilus sp. Marseille-Q4582]